MSALLTARGSTRSWRRVRALVLDRDGGRCQLPVRGGTASNGGELCGAPATHVDHVVPRSRGGSDTLANLRAACASCNLRRGARSTSPDEPAPEGRAPTPSAYARRHPAWRW